MHDKAYGRLAHWLHWLALEPAAVRQLAFDLECRFAKPTQILSAASALNNTTARGSVIDPAAGAVYVCGLARSGTTMLLRVLAELDDFRSLTYRHMPFVLAPNLWRKISRHVSRETVATERAHGDGIWVDVDSPEGFEEVFWRTFGTSTSNPACLGCESPTPSVLAAFADYRALIANPSHPAPGEIPKQRRYLSKNNNNLMRLQSLCQDPQSTALLAFRHPVATARSLYRQHQRFREAQQEDPFTRRYMAWLGHHEFGLDHRPFCFAKPLMDASLHPDDPNYWLDYWNAVYQHVLCLQNVRFHLVDHDTLRRHPQPMLRTMLAILGVQADAATLARLISAPAPDEANTSGFDPRRLAQAQETHRALLHHPTHLYPPPP